MKISELKVRVGRDGKTRDVTKIGKAKPTPTPSPSPPTPAPPPRTPEFPLALDEAPFDGTAHFQCHES